jgi:hypothetical protein
VEAQSIRLSLLLGVDPLDRLDLLDLVGLLGLLGLPGREAVARTKVLVLGRLVVLGCYLDVKGVPVEGQYRRICRCDGGARGL